MLFDGHPPAAPIARNPQTHGSITKAFGAAQTRRLRAAPAARRSAAPSARSAGERGEARRAFEPLALEGDRRPAREEAVIESARTQLLQARTQRAVVYHGWRELGPAFQNG